MPADPPTTPPPANQPPTSQPFTKEDFLNFVKSDEGKAALRPPTPEAPAAPTSAPKPEGGPNFDAAIEAYMRKRDASSEATKRESERDATIATLKDEVEKLKKNGRRFINSIFDF